MGRYFTTTTGREGKFAFAVQSSTDPEEMGMHENTGYNYYWAGEDEYETIKKKLDEQYDLLGFKGKRLYELPDDYDEWEHKNLYPLAFEEMPDAEVPEGADRYWCDKGGYTAVSKGEGLVLAKARIYLCLVILTDIKETGFCEMQAEV